MGLSTYYFMFKFRRAYYDPPMEKMTTTTSKSTTTATATTEPTTSTSTTSAYYYKDVFTTEPSFLDHNMTSAEEKLNATYLDTLSSPILGSMTAADTLFESGKLQDSDQYGIEQTNAYNSKTPNFLSSRHDTHDRDYAWFNTYGRPYNSQEDWNRIQPAVPLGRHAPRFHDIYDTAAMEDTSDLVNTTNMVDTVHTVSTADSNEVIADTVGTDDAIVDSVDTDNAIGDTADGAKFIVDTAGSADVIVDSADVVEIEIPTTVALPAEDENAPEMNNIREEEEELKIDGRPVQGKHPVLSNPVPGNPGPGNLALGNPALGNLAPSNLAPGNAAPGNLAPGNPAPVNQAPGNQPLGNPAPGNPGPGNLALGNPALGNLAPGNPAPGNPAPGYPAPGNPVFRRRIAEWPMSAFVNFPFYLKPERPKRTGKIRSPVNRKKISMGEAP